MFAIVVLIATTALLLAWLLLTTSGRDAALGITARFLPKGSLTWQRADGVLGRSLTLHGLRFQHDGVTFSAKRVSLEPRWLPLLRDRVRLDALRVDDATLDLPIDHTPQPPPRWPDVLPKFDLPITLDVAQIDVRTVRISRERTPLLTIATAHGGALLAPGRLRIDRLIASTDRGEFRIDGAMNARRSYATRIAAQWQAPAGADAADLHLIAGGDLQHFVLSVSGHAPAPLAVKLTLDNGQRVPDWSLSATAHGLDTQRVAALAGAADHDAAAAVAPWHIDLTANGTGGAAKLRGRIAQGERALTIAPSQLDYENGVLSAHPLALDMLDGRVRVTGRADFKPAAPTLDATVDLDRIAWRADPSAEPVRASGTLSVRGTLAAWQTNGMLDLRRSGEAARLALALDGDGTQATIHSLDATTPAGKLHANGHLRWSPALQWNADATLDRFDPGYLAPGFDGAVSARLQASGAHDALAGMALRAAIDGLSGTLRKRALGGSGTLEWAHDTGKADIDLRIGGSHVQAKGTFGSRFDLVTHLDPLRLDDLLLDARGSVSGRIVMQGALPLPALQGQLTGSGLQWRQYAAAHLALDGRIDDSGKYGALRVDADGIGGLAAITQAHLQFNGSPTQPRVTGNLAGSLGSLELSASAQRTKDVWNAQIATLRYAPTRGAAWTLSAPANLRIDARGSIALPSACLQSAAASLCAQADWPRRASAQARSIPMGWLDAWIARPDFDAHADGVTDLDVNIAPARGGFTGSAQLRSAQGALRLPSQPAHPLLGYSNLSVHAALDGPRVQATLSSDLSAGGHVQAQVTGGLAADAPLQGEASIDLRDVTWLELFSTDIAAPSGRFGGQLALAGSLAHPQLSGRLQLADFAAELPALGVALKDGHVQIDADASGAATISGALKSGDGSLAIGGGWRWDDFDAPLTVTLKGDNLRIADTPELEAVAAPDLQLGFAAGTLTVRGNVDVPTAKLDLERLDSTISPSPDVVVLDPRQKQPRSPLKVDVDLQLALGKHVTLKGFGLDGTLGGALRVRKPAGAGMTANGALDVGGRYAAYGQQLEIERGRLTYNGGGFDDPALDVLAQRQFDDGVTVGVRVRGSARRPQTQIVSTPAMDPSNALAYLVIGRPLQSADANETKQIGAASAALAVGSNLLAQKVATRLGLDSAGVGQSRALGGETFTVGKYLSPRLFVSYGVALAGTGEVLTLKYLLRKGFDVSIESAKENRASVNWRIER
ncbi:MAG: translocation/assembly module TamB domain-containing protein [Proteobacteria bacterium]|nr:translocation/assembly module TamB domain-containing protein [Pseudomonadota bacterium]